MGRESKCWVGTESARKCPDSNTEQQWVGSTVLSFLVEVVGAHEHMLKDRKKYWFGSGLWHPYLCLASVFPPALLSIGIYIGIAPLPGLLQQHVLQTSPYPYKLQSG